MATPAAAFPGMASDVRSRTLAPARAPWSIYAVLFASLSVILGVIWDISWHRTIGRDTFWTPAHMRDLSRRHRRRPHLRAGWR